MRYQSDHKRAKRPRPKAVYVPPVARPADNAAPEVRGVKLVVTVDLEVELGPSTTGRSTIIGNTHGFRDIPGMPGYWYNVLVAKKRPTEEGETDEAAGLSATA